MSALSPHKSFQFLNILELTQAGLEIRFLGINPQYLPKFRFFEFEEKPSGG
jgi:hypothetical protein